jgi:transcriptional regulator with XRE-family HTH domain
MWKLAPTDEYQRRQKRYEKDHPRELQAVLDNLDTYFKSLEAGVKPLQIKHGFLHNETLGVVAIDQKGGGKSLAQTRLYVYPEAETELLHVISLATSDPNKPISLPAGHSSPNSGKRDRIPMKKPTQHRSVSDMVRDLSEDRAFAEEFANRLSERQLIKVLTVLRTRAGLSQQELAERLQCTQSKVSKLESSKDADVRLGDLMNYTGAVGYGLRVFLVPKGQKIVDEVKMHACVISRLLDRLVKLAGEGGVMTRAVARFLGEATFNLTRLVKEAAAGLPALAEEPSPPLQVEAPEVAEEKGEPGNTRPRAQRARQAAAARS